eukprot:CAMPEP_0170553838 /NCGR_PEP_ID=MMETSP0211-20121228/11671_1 /TAXON_ID=311385 /ORGANISM="Pseudokeronopsis sp., Strain OXSARD2" /LENGTH=99 /DNA_ID=CAMNT_0010862433 /DNA_START=54 /DNA_END=353 /DNA_ORIENTATION=-
MTHYHIDHVSSLGGLINNTDIPITLIIPKDLLLPFAGWYLENYLHIINKIQNGQLSIEVIEDEWMDLNGWLLKALLPHKFEDSSMKHYTTNALAVFKNT